MNSRKLQDSLEETKSLENTGNSIGRIDSLETTKKKWKREEIQEAIEMRKCGVKFKIIGFRFNVTCNAARKALQRHWHIYKKDIPKEGGEDQCQKYVTPKYIEQYGTTEQIWTRDRSFASNMVRVNSHRQRHNLPMFVLRTGKQNGTYASDYI